MFRKLLAGAPILFIALLSPPAFAAEPGYPTKPIRIVVPVNPGGTSDYLARLVGKKLSENIKVPVVIDNRPGAGGINGSIYAAKAVPDGYTLFLASGGTHSINPSLYKKLPYDPIKDFEPVIRIATTPNVLVVNQKLSVDSVSDLLKYVKKTPTGLSFASSGKGSSIHLAGETFKKVSGEDIVHIPYTGSAPALMDLMGGTVTMMFDNLPSALPHIKGGKLKALAVTSATRSPAVPSVPTMAEAGLNGFEMNTWFGILVPKETPSQVIAYLNKELLVVLKDKEIQKQLLDKGAEVAGNSTIEFQAFMASEIKKWKSIAQAANVEAE